MSGDWLLVSPDRPLVINREGLQGLHLMFDVGLYQPNYLFNDEPCGDPCDNPRYLFALRNPEEKLITPEVVLVTESGEELELTLAIVVGGAVAVGVDHLFKRFFAAIYDWVVK